VRTNHNNSRQYPGILAPTTLTNDNSIEENILHAIVVATVHVARKHLPQSVRVRKEEEKRSKQVRKEVEKIRADTVKEKEELVAERMQVASTSEELRTEMGKLGEEARGWKANISGQWGDLKKRLDEVVDTLHVDEYFEDRPNAAPTGRAWGGGPPPVLTAGLPNRRINYSRHSPRPMHWHPTQRTKISTGSR
jgi:FtsZ-binding cell division protein ZapB